MQTIITHVQKAERYARGVINGDILAGEFIRLACVNHIEDLGRQSSHNFPYYFKDHSANRVCKFIESFDHVKGKWAAHGEALKLEDWQCFFICCVFGWLKKSNNLRRYRVAELYVPRKNGKSFLASAIGLYMLTADGEHGAEVYSGATTEKQAWEVFKPAKLMAQKKQEFLDHYDVTVNASNICIFETGAKFEPLIGNPGDGSSPSCAIIDEYHEHKDDRLLDTMITGMGAREQPLALVITTAGDNIAGPCYAAQLESQKRLTGAISESEIFSLIYTIDAGDDWTTVDALKKANPNYGVSVSAEFLQARLNEALTNARKQATYKTKHLNVWVGSRNAYFNLQRWTSTNNPDLKLEDFLGMPCYMGLDLASRVDIAAISLLFPLENGDFARFGRYFLPETAIENSGNEHYRGWAIDGWLTITDGEIIDFNEIKTEILEMCTKFEAIELAFDPFQATMLITELMNEGVNVVEVRPTVLNFSEPMKTLDGLIRAGKIQHNADPVYSWMLSNVTAKMDKKENVYPNKESEGNKIDGVVSDLMALNRAIAGGGNNTSVPTIW